MLSLSGRRGTVVAASLVTILLLPLAVAAQTDSESPDASPATETGTKTGDQRAAWQTIPDLAQRRGHWPSGHGVRDHQHLPGR